MHPYLWLYKNDIPYIYTQCINYKIALQNDDIKKEKKKSKKYKVNILV